MVARCCQGYPRASNLRAMASNLLVMASNLLAMASNLVVMASNLERIAKDKEILKMVVFHTNTSSFSFFRVFLRI